MNTDNLKSYKLIEKKDLVYIASTGYLLKHIKSGARVMLVENDDNNKTFSIAFRTPPSDNTGVAHITEHSVLSGSKKFPVKDPFMELVKGSMNTFLNAMTYPDKTVYPVASTNDKDFQNLMDVYLDAVFHPSVLEHDEVFRQEGITYNLESKDAELKYNGVVYNEMKGAFSSADDVVERKITEALYPDTCYGVESGGDPDYIPELTYEKFKEFHGKFYHPCNSYIYLYGNMDMEKVLTWMDREYLSEYDEIEVNSKIEYQKPFDKMHEIQCDYPIGEEESTKDNAYLSLSFVTGSILDKESYVAMQILDYAILSRPGAPIRQALIDAGIGEDINGGYSNYIFQPYFDITAKKANARDKDRFYTIVMEELRKLKEEGIDKEALLAGINNYEFQYRENDFGAYPKGLMYILQMYDSWIYDDDEPFRYIELNKIFENIRSKLDTNYFEELIDKYFLSNNHCALLVFNPVAGMASKKDEELRVKLAKIKASMSEEELDYIVERTRQLKEYQNTPSTPQQLDTIPVLERSDLSLAGDNFVNDVVEVEGVKIVRHDLFTNGIGYLKMFFDTTDMPNDMNRYGKFLISLLGYIDTKEHSYGDLANIMAINTGSLDFSTNLNRNSKDTDKYKMGFEINSKIFFDKIGKTLEIIKEIIFESKLDDKKRIREMIKERKASLQSVIMKSGDSVATLRNLSYVDKISVISENIRGISYYKFLEDLDYNFDDRIDDLIENLKNVAKCIFRKDNLIISYTATDEGYEKLKATLPDLLHALEVNNEYADTYKDLKEEVVPEVKNEGFKTSSQVQYVSRCGNFKKMGYDFDGGMLVLKSIITNEYLWKNIRELGGAYGCNCNFTKGGYAYFTSYRDPNCKSTYDIMSGISEFVRNYDTDERSMTKHIIGTFSKFETPKTAKTKGEESFYSYISDRSEDELAIIKEEAIAVTPEKIRSYADMIEAVLENSTVCAVGNEAKIEKDKEIFMTTKNLFR